MELLSLPTELFEAILHHAIVVRGIKRGLRLRLVNKTFACAVLQALQAHLLQLGAHAKGSCRLGPRQNSPIREASMFGHVAIVELLLERGADSKEIIAIAAEWGHTELVRRLLNAGITPAGALSKAAAGGYLGVVRLLLDAGVDANEGIGLESPLAGSIGKEHAGIFSLLLERGADLHSMGTVEECVQRAKKDGLESMLLLLKAHGADIGE